MSANKVAVDFTELDEQDVAVVLKQGADELVYRGRAVLQRDDSLGRILRIRSEDPQAGDPELILSESTWAGRIVPNRYGCSFCLIPSPQP